MDGRVKTLHPAIHGGLLAVRDDPDHVAAMEANDIEPFDLVVINLYPFEEVVAADSDYPTTIENIDIGGPAMVRASAKNHAYVTIVTDPADYAEVIAMLAENESCSTLEKRKVFAARAFQRTASYDAMISSYMAEQLSLPPVSRHHATGGTLSLAMRYGENPHQAAGLYLTGEKRPGVATATLLQGKALSYNNINDTDAAYELASEFDTGKPAVAIIKHANPCGVATGETLADAYRKAFACDQTSAFGGIVALNGTLDAEAAEEIVKIFTEVIIAPSVTDEATAIVAAKKKPAAADGGIARRSARQGHPGQVGCRRLSKTGTRQCRRRRSRPEMRDEAPADGSRARRHEVRLPRRKTRQVERHRLCSRRRDRRYRPPDR